MVLSGEGGMGGDYLQSPLTFTKPTLHQYTMYTDNLYDRFPNISLGKVLVVEL